MNAKTFFKGKKVTVMGLGLLGRGVGDAKFLAEMGAELIVTDIKNAEELAPSLEKLKEFSNITYRLGEHQLEDFGAPRPSPDGLGRPDFILKAAGVPLDSPYIAEARKNGIPIEMDESLFVKLSPRILTVGITGTRGKSTTASLIFQILKRAYGAKKGVYLGGNMLGVATLPLLSEIKYGDIVVLELASWQLQGFADAGISPHVAVFTNFMDDHLNYYKGDREAYFRDKAAIFRYQTSKDVLVVGEDVAPRISLGSPTPKSKIIVPTVADIPDDWKLPLPGRHNRENISLALAVADEMKVSRKISRAAIESFGGVPGRLEMVRKIRGVSIYNDTTATTADATLAALRALGERKNIALIMGGADKGLSMDVLINNLHNYCTDVFLLPGSGSERIGDALRKAFPRIHAVTTLSDALAAAHEVVHEDGIILLSPAFASFGQFKNEYDRGDQFVELVNNLK